MKSIAVFFMIVMLGSILLNCAESPKANVEEKNPTNNKRPGFVYLSAEQLKKLGVYIKDTAIMYNNNIEGVGSLDIAIRDKEYHGGATTIDQTNFKFYPRYITTLDTIQRAMYMIWGDQSRAEEEARKWQHFESLVPVVVEQTYDGYEFGETLIFWMTKTQELEILLEEIKGN